MDCPICGKKINIEKDDRENTLQKLTAMRIKLGKLDSEIKSVMEHIN